MTKITGMQERRLSPDAEICVGTMFGPVERDVVREILIEGCGNNLPFCEGLDPSGLDRCRFAVLKLSQGNMEKLKGAIALAKQDWRDLLVAAGFAHDTTAHRKWFLERKV